LGTALLSRLAAPHVHFVDIVPELINDLRNKLQRFYPDSPSHWHTHCLDSAALPIEQYDGKHLVIIAGVGGDVVTHLVNTLHRNHAAAAIDFLLCPVYHQFKLRQRLIQLNFSLMNEVLIEENRRFYEILLVSSPAGSTWDTHSPISRFGELIWQTDSAQQSKMVAQYLDNTLNHYKRMQSANNPEVQDIINGYRRVNI